MMEPHTTGSAREAGDRAGVRAARDVRFERMRIVVVALVFPPGTGPGVARPLAWANHLARRGHDVTVLTAELATQVRCSAWKEAAPAYVHPAIRVVKLGGLAVDALFQRMGRLRLLRVAKYLGLAPEAGWSAAVAAWLARNADPSTVVISSGWPFAAHVACLAAREVLRSAPGRDGAFVWIADYRDPWVLCDNPHATPAHLAAVRALDRAVHRGADRITYTSYTDLRAALEAYGVDPRRGLVVRNGIDPGHFDQPGSTAPAPRIVFAGNLYVSPEGIPAGLRVLDRFYARAIPYDYTRYSLVPLFRAVAAARRASGRDVTVSLVGGIPEALPRRALEMAGEPPDAPWVQRLPHVGRAELSNYVRESAALYLPLFGRADGVPIGRVPQKTFELLATDRAILASAPPGEMRDLLRGRGGVFHLEGDAAVDGEAVLRALAAAPARPAGRWNFRRESQARAIEAIAARALRERGRGRT